MAFFGLTQKLGDIVSWNKLGLRLSKLRDAWMKYQEANPMEAKAAVLNALKHVGYSALAVGGYAILAHFETGAALTDAFKSLPPAVVAILVPLLHGAIVTAEKWWKGHFSSELNG